MNRERFTSDAPLGRGDARGSRKSNCCLALVIGKKVKSCDVKDTGVVGKNGSAGMEFEKRENGNKRVLFLFWGQLCFEALSFARCMCVQLLVVNAWDSINGNGEGEGGRK